MESTKFIPSIILLQTILALSTEDLKASSEAHPTETISPTELAEQLKSTESSKLTTIEKQNTTEIAADVTANTLVNVSPTAATVFPTYSTYQPFAHLSWYPQAALAPLPLTSYRYEPVAQVAPVAQVSHIAPVYSQFHSQVSFRPYTFNRHSRRWVSIGYKLNFGFKLVEVKPVPFCKI